MHFEEDEVQSMIDRAFYSGYAHGHSRGWAIGLVAGLLLAFGIWFLQTR